MSLNSDSPSSSQYLSSSQSSLTPSKKASSEISKTYKHASQLYLTRRLAEAYEAIQPVITPPAHADAVLQDEDEPLPQIPIASATTSQRVKIWSLYATLLNAILDLGHEDGKREFGQKEYRDIVHQVRNGEVWEQVVRNGYGGREGSVDAEVVYNLSTLLLGQALDQRLNQSRLEAYLSSSSQPNLADVSRRLSSTTSSRPRPHMNGTNTPKDLASRLKILELFTLHVLPKNEEWEYARSFISNSDILDEERREAFLQTLQELQDIKDPDDYQDEVFEDDETETEESQKQQNSDMRTEVKRSVEATSPESDKLTHKRTSSEVDYGIDMSHPNGMAKKSNGHAAPTAAPAAKLTKPSADPKSSLPSTQDTKRKSPLSPPSQTPRNRPVRKSTQAKSDDMFTKARSLIRALQNLALNMAGAITKNPTNLLRMMLFILAFLMAFSRRDVRDRARQILGTGMQKVRGTVGMGMKVSYI